MVADKVRSSMGDHMNGSEDKTTVTPGVEAMYRVLHRLSILFALLTLSALVGVILTDDWYGANPFGVPFFVAASLWLIIGISAGAVKRSIRAE